LSYPQSHRFSMRGIFTRPGLSCLPWRGVVRAAVGGRAEGAEARPRRLEPVPATHTGEDDVMMMMMMVVVMMMMMMMLMTMMMMMMTRLPAEYDRDHDKPLPTFL
jgi:hypothetical protein